MLPSLYHYRGLIWRNAVADLRHRYAGTGLGLFWNVVHPLALIAVFSLVFATIFNNATGLQVPGVSQRFHFLLYLCAGLLPWLAFAECVTRGTNAFAENAAYLKKLPIPEQVFVAQSAASATLGLAISFALLLVISLVLGLRPTWHWALLPVPLIALQAIGFAVGLLCGTLNVFFRDIGQVTGIVLQVVMWTVPVVYARSALSPAIQSALRFHPLAPPLDAIRALFLYGQLPDAWTWAGLVAWPTLLTLVAAGAFGALRKEIRDLI
jgi:ABC-type polysaccharide/polyol phosphate export permease